MQGGGGGGSSTTATPRGGGGGGNTRNNNRNRNKPKNKNKPGGGGGATDDEASVGPALPELNASLGLNAPNTGGNNGAFGMQSAGFGLGNSPLFSDTSEYESSRFNTDPQGGFNAFASSAGMAPMGQDNFGRWLQSQYEIEQQNFNTLKADDQNQNLSWFDHLGNLSGVQYGQPGWEDAYKKFWMGRYNNDSMANRGLSDTPYSGQTRWLALG
jgi:hypothetical protein